MGRHSAPSDGRWLVGILFEGREALVACIAGMLLISVAPVLLGWKPTVVVSGSMMPAIKPGDVVVAGPAPHHIKPGTVLLVKNPASPDELLMHRVVRFQDAGHFITKGDANPTEDSTPVPVGNVVGQPRIRVPYVGLPYLWIRQGHYVPVGAAGILLLALLLWRPTVTVEAPRRPDRSVLDGPLDADPYRIRNSAALPGYSIPAGLRPKKTPEAAAAVSLGHR